ncbi:rCG56295, partial [Rattus norvegicus]
MWPCWGWQSSSGRKANLMACVHQIPPNHGMCKHTDAWQKCTYFI